jgi:hypothetical protein
VRKRKYRKTNEREKGERGVKGGWGLGERERERERARETDKERKKERKTDRERGGGRA